ncbi:MAG TPA: sialidase family protein [Myxococcota bacterium]|nr:sialidase family protein [Myxococcota bacterium]
MVLGWTLLGTLGLLAWLWLRPNQSRVHPALGASTWDAVTDGLHNSNTDLIHHRGQFLLVHAASPYHMGSSDCRLIVRRSADARRWEKLAELRMPGEDIRDPKFAVIAGKLFLYALPNRGFYAVPYGTVYSTSETGEQWSPFERVVLEGTEPEGWLFWRPKTRDQRTWYVPAYWNRHGRSILLQSEDGVRWKRVSEIWFGEGNDETDIEWLPDGRLLATARLEVTPDRLLGNRDASTLLATAAPPYERWSYHKSRVTRLDGPALFAYDGRIYAVARYQAGARGALTRLGGSFSRKRTSLFLVEPERLVRLSDLPSAGDTSYAGVVLKDDSLFASYYTSDIRRDYPWILGMLLPTDIRMAQVPLDRLAEIAREKAGPKR